MNIFGKNFRVMTFGESHGRALGAIIDGCPPNIKLSEEDIQKELDRRRPGQSEITTQRKESDKVEILSGVFEGKTLGTPIAALVYNQDSKSKDYSNIKDLFRPGHADEAWQSKFGFRDYRGGGRSSGRETLSRVIAGAIAKKLLKDTLIVAHVVQVHSIIAKRFDPSVIEKNPVRCADAFVAKDMEEAILTAKKDSDTLGGKIEILIKNCPKNIGEPVFAKLQSKLAEALFTIGTVRGVELMPGNDVAHLPGSESNKISFGISGGISTSEDIRLRVSLKPPPSIGK